MLDEAASEETNTAFRERHTGHNVFPSSVLIVYAHLRPHTLGAAGPTAGQVFARGIFIAVH